MPTGTVATAEPAWAAVDVAGGVASSSAAGGLLGRRPRLRRPVPDSTRPAAARLVAVARGIPSRSHAPPSGWAVSAGRLTLRQRAAVGALAGGVAGGAVNALLHPLDTLKTRMQARGASYAGPLDALRTVLSAQGVRGLYRGLPAAVAGSVPSSALYFGTYEFMKGVLALALPPSAAHLAPPLAAALGNAASSAILVPKEVLKQRAQLAGIGVGGAWAQCVSVVRAQGLGGLYAGYGATLARNLPTNVINFSLFESLKSWRLQARAAAGMSAEISLPPHEAALAGACSGAAAALVTTPLDVAKTRLMTQGLAGASLGRYARGLLPTLRQIAAEEGLRGLTRGMEPRLAYSALFSAAGFGLFETARAALSAVVVARSAGNERREGVVQGGGGVRGRGGAGA